MRSWGQVKFVRVGIKANCFQQDLDPLFRVLIMPPEH